MEQILKWFDDYKFVAVIRSGTTSNAEEMIKAAMDGGFRIFEISANTPQGFRLIETYSKREGMVVGAGGITDGEIAQRAINAGSAFISSNYTDQEIINVAKHNDSFVIQGVSTATEAVEAYHYGADFVKFFPAALLGGTDYIREIRENLPFLKIVAEGGILIENAFEYLKHCVSVCVDKALFDKPLVRQDNWSEITERAKKLTQKLESLKAVK
jgi:2-dehydro-3-deoxyphosphogluconate aldolase / (4S)-4-hydroxy-2-oxoglutarate aldolase